MNLADYIIIIYRYLPVSQSRVVFRIPSIESWISEEKEEEEEEEE